MANNAIATGSHTAPELPPALAVTVARFHAAGWLREVARLTDNAAEMERQDKELERLGRALDARTAADP